MILRPEMNIRSKVKVRVRHSLLGLGDRVAGVSYAGPSSALLVYLAKSGQFFQHAYNSVNSDICNALLQRLSGRDVAQDKMSCLTAAFCMTR